LTIDYQLLVKMMDVIIFQNPKREILNPQDGWRHNIKCPKRQISKQNSGCPDRARLILRIFLQLLTG